MRGVGYMHNPKTNPASLLFNAIAKNHIGLIAFILISTTCDLWIVGKPVPDLLEKIDLIIIAFMFGSKVGNEKK